MKVLHIGNALGGGGAENVFADSVLMLRARAREHDRHDLATCSALYSHPSLVPDLELDSWTRGGVLNRAAYFYSFRNADRLAHYLARQMPDVIHLHGFLAHLSASILRPIAAHRRRQPCAVIQTVHSHELICANASAYDWSRGQPCTDCMGEALKLRIFHRNCDRRGWLYSWGKGLRHLIYRTLLDHPRCVDHYIAPSRFVRETLIHEGLDPGRITVLRNPVNQSAPTERAPSPRVIVSFGRFSPEKNLPLLIHAFNRLAIEPSMADLRLHLIGDGEEKMHIAALAAQSPVRDRISLPGYLEPDALKGALGDASLMVMPSRALETYAMVIPEAVALGIIPIAANRGAMPEMIRLLGCGDLFEADQVQSLVDCLRKALQGLPDSLVPLKAAQRIIGSELSAATYCNLVTTLYAGTIASVPGR